MNRKRKSGRDLPQRVYIKFGAYYFVPAAPMIDPRTPKAPAKSWIQLCRVDAGKAKMHAELGLVLGERNLIPGSIPHCVKEYKAAILTPDNYGDQAIKENGRMLDKFAAVHRDFHASEITTKDCAEYLREKYKGKANTAKKMSGQLARLFRYIIGELGLRQDNPIDQLELAEKTKKRKVLITHAQVLAIRAAGMKAAARKDTGHEADTLSGPTFAAILDMTYLAWQRGIDIRTMRDPKEEDVIRTLPSKTEETSGKVVDMHVTPAIKEVIRRAQAIKREHKVVSAYLFPALAGESKGHPYTKSGLSSMWRRAIARAGLDELDIQFKDIRALAATDAAKAGVSKDEIRKRLVHTTTKTSEIYIKEAIPEVSALDVRLPWPVDNAE